MRLWRRTLFRVCLIALLSLAIWLLRLELTSNESVETTDVTSIEFVRQRQYVESLFKTITSDASLIHEAAFFTVVFAERNNLPPALLAAIIIEESELIPTARGKAGELGLMQVYPKYWENRFPDCGTDLLDIKTNICYGSRILRRYIDEENGSMINGIRKYNGGSRRYVEKVNTRLANMHLVERCY